MSITFVAATDSQNLYPAPAAETFALASADQTAFPRFFPYSLTAFKIGMSPQAGTFSAAPGFNMGIPEIKAIAQSVIQAALVGGGMGIGAATARAEIIARQSCAVPLLIAILTDAGA